MKYPLSLLSAITLSLALSLTVAGCKSSQPSVQDATNDGSTLNGPISDQPGTSGEAHHKHKAGEPGAPGYGGSQGQQQGNYNQPAGHRAAPVTLTVEPGAAIEARINETLNAKTSNVGESFSGELTKPLTTRTGDVVIPAGAPVSGTVIASKGQGRFAGAAVIAIELSSIAGTPVQTTDYSVGEKGKGKRTATMVGGGAGLGALIGGLAGGKKGALIGGLAGAGAGTAGAGLTGNKPLVIPAGSAVSFQLSNSISRTVNR